MMHESRHFAWYTGLLVAAVSMVAAGQTNFTDNQNPKDRERKLIAVLQSDVPPADKAIPCKQLAVYGTKDAVAALAPLLSHPELASWARIALEAIPDPAADEALRDAMGKVQGRLLVGVINSIGVRRDVRAVDGLANRLKDADAGVASAAGVALGRIGGSQAAMTLEQSLAGARVPVRSAVAEGCILCAERFCAEQKNAEAVKLYDAVRRADVPRQRILEATRGAILARGADGVPLLMEQLRSADKAQFSIGLRTARELGGRDVTEALAAELERLDPSRRPLLLLAVADRRDAGVLPVVLKAVKSGPKGLRIEAAKVLTRLGDVSCIPALLDAAGDTDVELAQAARTALSRLPGEQVDVDLVSRLSRATGTTRQVLIELAGQRQLTEALAAVVSSIEDSNPGIRSAAIQTVGVIGQSRQAADLVRGIQKPQSPEERANTEKALMSLSGRWKADCVPHLLPLMRSGDSSLRVIGLRTLAIAGGPNALAAVKTAIDDKDETVQDEAVRTLSTWPNSWPGDVAAADVLLTLAKSGRKMTHQVLGLRGYLEYVRGDDKLDGPAKVAKVDAVLPLIQRPEEKRLAISVLGAAPTARSLELLTTFASESAIVEEACAALVNLAGKDVQGLSSGQRRGALQTVIDKSKNNGLKKKAEAAIKTIQ